MPYQCLRTVKLRMAVFNILSKFKSSNQVLFKEARNSFFCILVDLFKSISRMEGFLRFPSYHTTFSTYDQILCFGWFPSNICYHSNGDATRLTVIKNPWAEMGS